MKRGMKRELTAEGRGEPRSGKEIGRGRGNQLRRDAEMGREELRKKKQIVRGSARRRSHIRTSLGHATPSPISAALRGESRSPILPTNQPESAGHAGGIEFVLQTSGDDRRDRAAAY